MSIPDMEDHVYLVSFLTPMTATEQASPHLDHALKTHFLAYRFINNRLLICRRPGPVPEGTEVVIFSVAMEFAGFSRKRWTAVLVAHLEYCLGRDTLKMEAFQESSGGSGYDERADPHDQT